MQEELAIEAGEEMPTSVEGKIGFLTKQAATLKRNLRQALKDADDARMAEKNEKDEVIDLQSRMGELVQHMMLFSNCSSSFIDSFHCFRPHSSWTTFAPMVVFFIRQNLAAAPVSQVINKGFDGAGKRGPWKCVKGNEDKRLGGSTGRNWYFTPRK